MENHEYLTDLEIEKIDRFNQDPVLSDAVKKVLFAVINERGVIKKGKKVNPLQNGALAIVSRVVNGQISKTDEELGNDLKTYYQGIGLLESGFQELSKIKIKKEEGTPKTNPAI
jgi:hypothetical protein